MEDRSGECVVSVVFLKRCWITGAGGDWWVRCRKERRERDVRAWLLILLWRIFWICWWICWRSRGLIAPTSYKTVPRRRTFRCRGMSFCVHSLVLSWSVNLVWWGFRLQGEIYELASGCESQVPSINSIVSILI